MRDTLRPVLIAALLALAACGADGPPARPGAAPAPSSVPDPASPPGIEFGGEFSLGLSL